MGNASFTAVGSAYKGQLNWGLISRIMRAQWEKAMASCCLGIVLQHRYESNAQVRACVRGWGQGRGVAAALRRAGAAAASARACAGLLGRACRDNVGAGLPQPRNPARPCCTCTGALFQPCGPT